MKYLFKPQMTPYPTGPNDIAPKRYVDARVLYADRTYYVRSDGSDTNDGLSDSSAGAFLSIQKAVNTAAAMEFNGFNVTISVGSGTYGAATLKACSLQGGSVSLIGDTTTPGNVVISASSASAISGNNAGEWTVKGFKVSTTTSGSGIDTRGYTNINVGNMDFGACATNHIYARDSGRISVVADYVITGSATVHMYSSGLGNVVMSGRTVTLNGTLTFSQFALAVSVANIYAGACTFTVNGSVSGTRYYAGLNGVINTNGGGASYLPGNSAGSVASGGVYA